MSNVVITFTNDWVNDDELIFSASSQIQSYTFKWVTLRSSSREVTTGTPTATAGETAAINFKAAFDLDFTSGYTTSISSNEVTITSTTSGEQFYVVEAGWDNGTGTATVVITNDAVDSENISLGLVRSPYYVNVPFSYSTTTKATINLYVWSGDIGTVPSTASYVLTKIRPTVDYEEFNVNLSEVTKDSLDYAPLFQGYLPAVNLIDSNSDAVKWCKYVVEYTDASVTIPDLEDYFAVTEGYGYYDNGINPSLPNNAVLTDCTHRKVDRNGIVLFPIVNNGTITTVDVSTENNQINDSKTITVSDQSDEYIQYIVVNVDNATTDEFLTFTVNPSGDTFVYEITDECRYEPLELTFVNRYGAFETLTLFKKQSKTLNVESEEFVNNYVSGGTYDITKHQIHKINVQGKESLTVNSGYLDEQENELYKQLLLSEKVWLFDGGYVPVNIKSSTLDFKTRVNDRLVNYTIDLEYAYNTIQNV